MAAQTADAARPNADAWSRYIPMLVAVTLVWLLGRGLKKSFWTLFGVYWAVHWMW